MKDEIVQAFHLASQGFSPDRVVADPDLNRAYLSECNRLGLGSDAAKLNQSLLNLRKRGALRGLASRRTILKDQSDYRFAAEIAARFLERENEITLDHIICDPRYAERFDEIAKDDRARRKTPRVPMGCVEPSKAETAGARIARACRPTEQGASIQSSWYVA